jgi:prevent-host-death family protein
MTTVTLDEARAALPDLLRRVAAGEQVVLTDGGRWVAALAPPPPHPDELAARKAESDRRAKATVLAMFKDMLAHETRPERRASIQRHITQIERDE